MASKDTEIRKTRERLDNWTETVADLLATF